jgi:hypothetical protein
MKGKGWACSLFTRDWRSRDDMKNDDEDDRVGRGLERG